MAAWPQNGVIPCAADGTILYQRPTYTVEAAMAGATNKILIGLLNPGGSGKIIRVWATWTLVPASSGTTVIIPIEHRKISTLSAGTTVTPQTFDSADPASAATVMADGPTVTDVALWYTRIYQINSAQYAQGYFDPSSIAPAMKAITLRENEGLMLKQIANNGSTFRAGMTYTEE